MSQQGRRTGSGGAGGAPGGIGKQASLIRQNFL